MKTYFAFVLGALLGGALIFQILTPKILTWQDAYYSTAQDRDAIEKERRRAQRELTVCKFVKEFPGLGKD